MRSVTKGSAELREALLSEQAKIITTTLQKFPFVLRALDDADLGEKTYAVIVDEAHSSQSGESATDLKELLGSLTAEDLDLDEDDGTPPLLLARLAARGAQPNLSFFAFTATPKGKTLELFGSRPGRRLRAFHTYSMRQAIEEGFILNVLRNYTTYEQLYRLETKAEGTIEVPSGEGSRAWLASPSCTRTSRRRRPRSSSSTSSPSCARSSAARPRQWSYGQPRGGRPLEAGARPLDREHGYDDVEALVAFSGEVTVKDPEADN